MSYNQILPSSSSSSSSFASCFYAFYPKHRLRWNSDLHDRFVVAVARLGGPNEAKPTAIKQAMEAMGVHGLTLRHVKSHLQKYRANCKSGKAEEEQPKKGSSESTLLHASENHIKDQEDDIQLYKPAAPELIGRLDAEDRANLVLTDAKERDTKCNALGVHCDSTSQSSTVRDQMECFNKEVEEHVEMRKAAQERYMGSLIERAYGTVASEFLNSGAFD